MKDLLFIIENIERMDGKSSFDKWRSLISKKEVKNLLKNEFTTKNIIKFDSIHNFLTFIKDIWSVRIDYYYFSLPVMVI